MKPNPRGFFLVMWPHGKIRLCVMLTLVKRVLITCDISPLLFAVRFYPRCTAAGCVSPPFPFVSLFDILVLNHGVLEAKNCHLDLLCACWALVLSLDTDGALLTQHSHLNASLSCFPCSAHHLFAVKRLTSKMMGFPPDLRSWRLLQPLDLLPPCPALSGVSPRAHY